MKWILAISLVLNLVLGFLYIQKLREPPLERMIIEYKTELK